MLRKPFLLLLVGLCLCWTAVFARAEKPGMVHFVDTPYPPYSIGEVGKPATGGLAVELVRELFKRLGVEIRIEMYPWNRTLKMAESGRADGITLLMREAEREEYLVFSNVLFDGREVFYYRRDRAGGFEWSSFADLKPYRIGLVRGYTYGDDFVKAVDAFGLQVEYDDSEEISLQKLLAGRIDLFLSDELVATAQIARNPEMKQSFAQSSKIVTTYPYHVAFSRRSPAKDLLAEVNRVIAEMRADGTIARVLGRL